MFDAIAPTYDLLNAVLSGGIDALWRRRLIRSLGPLDGLSALDVACGTGDLLVGLAQQRPKALVGLDLAPAMLDVARRRLSRAHIPATLVNGAAESLPFGSSGFDVVTVAFGIRNFEDLSQGLHEMCRVLRPGGQLRILEFSRPRPGIWGRFFTWYFQTVLPAVGRWVSGHPDAYRYLPDSVSVFPDPAKLAGLLGDAGFRVTRSESLAGGVATLTIAERPSLELPRP